MLGRLDVVQRAIAVAVEHRAHAKPEFPANPSALDYLDGMRLILGPVVYRSIRGEIRRRFESPDLGILAKPDPFFVDDRTPIARVEPHFEPAWRMAEDEDTAVTFTADQTLGRPVVDNAATTMSADWTTVTIADRLEGAWRTTTRAWTPFPGRRLGST